MDPRRILGIYGEGTIIGAADLAEKIEKVINSSRSDEAKLIRINKLCRKAFKAEAQI